MQNSVMKLYIVLIFILQTIAQSCFSFTYADNVVLIVLFRDQPFPRINGLSYYIIMQKEQTKLGKKCEIKKQRVNGFPYYIVTTTFSAQDHFFIVGADCSSETAILTVYSFKSDMTKSINSTISLTDILPRKIIATIHVNNLIFKANSSSVNIVQGEFVIGYRTGQLIVVEYKDRETKVKYRYNRSLKGEGFLSRASSSFFGSEDTYNSYFKQPIRNFTLNPLIPDLYFIWQVGNNILLQNELSQGKENKFLSKHESLDFQNFYLNYDINKTIKQGDYFLYGCDYYTVLGNPQNRMFLITFKDEISSFVTLAERKELVVSLSSKEIILVLDLNNFVFKAIIRTQMPIRKLNYINRINESFLILMPYENYIILYSLNKCVYCKLKGHRSFIGNVCFNQKNEKIITAGMDHRISMIALCNINEVSWIPAEKQSQKCIKIKQYGIPDQKFDDIYHLGEYNNVRNNQYSYGFGDVFKLNGYFCFPTYDSRIIIYQL